jgi:hypothetical protein
LGRNDIPFGMACEVEGVSTSYYLRVRCKTCKGVDDNVDLDNLAVSCRWLWRLGQSSIPLMIDF